MGIMDAFNAEDRITVTVSKFGTLIKEAAKADILMNAVNCEVPYVYIREMMTGTNEEVPEVRASVAIPAGMFTDLFKDLMDKEEDDEPVCGDADTEEGDGSEGPEGGSGPEDGCDEDDGADGAGLED